MTEQIITEKRITHGLSAVTEREFVYGLWLESDEYDRPMDAETAALDLATFRKNWWDVPQFLTPERMAEIWNEYAGC